MSKTTTLRLDEPALAKVREQQFVDDAEMAEILEDAALLRRLRAGSRDAARRKGAFVD